MCVLGVTPPILRPFDDILLAAVLRVNLSVILVLWGAYEPNKLHVFVEKYTDTENASPDRDPGSNYREQTFFEFLQKMWN